MPLETISKNFTVPKNPNAKKERDNMARELRKAGWKVKTGKTVFSGDLCTGELYSLRAERYRPEELVELDWLLHDSICSFARMISSMQQMAEA